MDSLNIPTRLAHIYRLSNSVDGRHYIGSTYSPPTIRFSQHQSAARLGQHSKLYDAMRAFGYDSWTMEVLCSLPNPSRQTLHKVEGDYIVSHNSVANGYNTNIAGRTAAEWRAANKERMRENFLRYYEQNREKHIAYVAAYKAKRRSLFRAVDECLNNQDGVLPSAEANEALASAAA